MKYADYSNVVQKGMCEGIAHRYGVSPESAKKWLEDFPEHDVNEVMYLDPAGEKWNDCLREMVWGRTSLEEIRRICSDER